MMQAQIGNRVVPSLIQNMVYLTLLPVLAQQVWAFVTFFGWSQAHWVELFVRPLQKLNW